MLLLQFQFPIFGYFFAPYLLRLFGDKKRSFLLLFLILAISFATMIYEFLSGDLFNYFSRSGLRSVGPFVNPNNTGILLALVATGLHFNTKSFWKNLLVSTLSIGAIALSASKTGLALYSIGILFSLQIKSRIFFGVIFLVAIIFYLGTIVDSFQLLELREFSLESGSIRQANSIRTLGTIWSNSVLGFLFGSTNLSTIDNAYLDILTFGGVYLLLILLVSQVLAAALLVKQKQWALLVLLIQIIAAMMTTNIPRLWPTGYVYWALVGIAVLQVSHARSRLQNPQPVTRNRYINVH